MAISRIMVYKSTNVYNYETNGIHVYIIGMHACIKSNTNYPPETYTLQKAMAAVNKPLMLVTGTNISTKFCKFGKNTLFIVLTIRNVRNVRNVHTTFKILHILLIFICYISEYIFRTFFSNFQVTFWGILNFW